jgi:hypothetical protein
MDEPAVVFFRRDKKVCLQGLQSSPLLNGRIYLVMQDRPVSDGHIAIVLQKRWNNRGMSQDTVVVSDDVEVSLILKVKLESICVSICKLGVPALP